MGSIRKILICATLLLSACGPKIPRMKHGVDPLLKPYLDRYLSYKHEPLYRTIPINFGDLPMTIQGQVVGRCYIYTTGQHQILVDKDSWNDSTENLRFQIIAHELGHCDLNRDHDDSILPNGMPASIMNSRAFYMQDSDIPYYMKELFK